MSKGINAPWLSYDDIRVKAASFLKKFNPQDKYPLPIEKIIDIQLRINIVPIPQLLELFEIDGFLCSNLKEIWVDRKMYDRRPVRYNFTLTHEIGHFFLHKDIYREYKIEDIDGWKKFHQDMSERELNWFEWQAKSFAAIALVPLRHLERSCKHHLKMINSLHIRSKYNILDRLLDLVAKDFRVSKLVIKKRLEKEALLPKDLQSELVLKF